MAYKPLARLRRLDTGIWPGLHEVITPLWKDGRNVVFRSGGVAKMKGWSSINSGGTGTSSAIRGMTQQLISGTQYLFYGDANRLFNWDAGTSTARTISKTGGYTGRITETAAHPVSFWSFVDWGTWILASNGKDALQVWKASGNFQDLETSGTFTTAEILVKSGPYVLAFNTSNGANQFNWCHTDDVEEWSSSDSNAAGTLTIRDMDSEIIAAVPLGDRIAVYGENAMYIVSYRGSPFYFGWQPGLAGPGAVSKASVIPVGRKNYGLCQQGFFETDGVNFRWIDETTMPNGETLSIRPWFQSRVNWSQKSKICAWHDRENTQIIWYYPTSSSEPDEGLGYDYQRNVWTVYDHGRTAAVMQQVFDYPLAATNAGKVYYQNYGKQADGGVLNVYLETKAADWGVPEYYKVLQEIRAGITELSGTVTLSVAGMHTMDETVSYGAKHVLDDSYEEINVLEHGRWNSLKVEASATDSDFVMVSLDIFGKVTSLR